MYLYLFKIKINISKLNLISHGISRNIFPFNQPQKRKYGWKNSDTTLWLWRHLSSKISIPTLHDVEKSWWDRFTEEYSTRSIENRIWRDTYSLSIQINPLLRVDFYFSWLYILEEVRESISSYRGTIFIPKILWTKDQMGRDLE